MPRTSLPPAAVLAGLCCALGAAPPAPPAPATYDVAIRYRIDAFQNERVAQFNAMMKELADRGFRRDPNDEPVYDEPANPKADRLRGTVPAANARSLLLEPHVHALLLLPAGAKLPDDANQPVRVTLDLIGGLPPDRQRLLHGQTAEALGSLKFAEAVGYDDRGNTRLVGSVPSGQVEALLNYPRTLPAGKDLPVPFARTRTVRVIEARPDLPAPAPRPPAPEVPAGQARVAGDLREVLADAARADKPLRFEVLLAAVPPAFDRSWQDPLGRAAPGSALEGLLGTVVTVKARPDQAPALAELPEVVGVRLPRVAQVAPVAADADEAAALKATGLDRLHAKGYRGKGTRIAVVAADFRGWEALVGKGLPKGTRLLDLTRERNANLEPDPFPAGNGPGQGTLFAKAAAAAAPEASLVLVRVDPAAPYMVQSVARAVAGESAESLALEQRGRDIRQERGRLEVQQAQLLEERRRVFSDLREEDEPLRNREQYEKKQAAHDEEAREHGGRVRRYLDHQAALLGLKDVRVVASQLVWDAGYPGGGSSALSRTLDDRPAPSALWIQPAGAGRGQTWTGLFRNAPGEGVMEFAPPDVLLPSGSWSRELNFLAWQPASGKPTAELPAGARVRLTFQWREAHDPALLQTGQDPYRDPLTSVRLLVLRQPDPAGRQRPADDLEVVAQSAGAARRLDQTPTSAAYEVSVEWRVPEAGRYAVRVEGKPPESDRPANFPVLPSLRRSPEIRPRVVLDTLDGNGRAVWNDFRGDSVSLGMPADARSVAAVAAGGSADFPRDDLTRKPDLVTPDGRDGEGFAAALAAGVAVSTGTCGVPAYGWPQALGVRPGGELRLPDGRVGR